MTARDVVADHAGRILDGTNQAPSDHGIALVAVALIALTDQIEKVGTDIARSNREIARSNIRIADAIERTRH